MKKIALAQIRSIPDVETNVINAKQFILKAVEQGADLIAFPENVLFIGDHSRTLEVAESIPGPLVEIFKEEAARYNISILLGSMLEKNPDLPDKVFNTTVLIGRNGDLLTTYRKIHLFDVDLPEIKYQESKNVSPGSRLVTCQHEIGIIGLTICYDLRFPCLFQKLSHLGAQIIFVPAAFMYQTGQYHWLPLLRARAIENQVYIAAPAQCGWHNKERLSYGNSILIDPWGKIINQAADTEELLLGDIDLSYLENIRTKMPIDSHAVEGID